MRWASCLASLFVSLFFLGPLMSWGGKGLHPPSAAQPGWSQSILELDEGNGLLFVSHKDSSQVIALDARSGSKVWEARVGEGPQYLKLHYGIGRSSLLVSCERSGEIWLLEPRSGRLQIRLPVGLSPGGFDLVDGRFLVVALRARHRVSIWDLVTGKQVGLVDVAPFPSAVRASPEGKVLYVGHFFSGTVSVLDSRTFQRTHTIPAAPEVNQVSALLAVERGRTLLVPHILSNTSQQHLHVANTIFPAISILDTRRRAWKTLQLSLIDRPVNGPEAIALLPKRKLLITVNSRSNDLSLLDWTTLLASAHVKVGRYPLGIVFDSGESRAFIANTHEQTLSVLDLDSSREIARWPYAKEMLPQNLARGRDLFHDASSRSMVFNQWVSCSNCHPGGHSDGRVWQLPGKPRLRTKDLHDLAATLPAGWHATQDEMQDEEIFIREFHRGTGLSPKAPNAKLGPSNVGLSRDLDNLSEYVYSLRTQPSPYLVNRKLSPAAERGRRLFHAPALGCLSCHPPPTFTISSLKDNRKFSGLLSGEAPDSPPRDVPSLLGLYQQPRFLHDGRAETVLDIFLRWNLENHHGRTKALKRANLEDLEAFLLSLPY